MAAKAGKNFLLKMGDGGGSEVFTVIGGTRQVQVTIDGETIDVSSQDAPNWKELLAGSGQRSLKVSASGVSVNGNAQEVAARNALINATINNWQIVDVDESETLSCAFRVTSFEKTGEYKDAVQWSISLESSGTPSYS